MSEALITPGIPDQLQFEYRLSRGVAVIEVRGKVDISTCGLLRERLLRVLTDRGRSTMVVNLAGVSFIDSSGLGVLVAVWHRVQAGPGMLALAAPAAQARALFAITGLAKIFSIFDTEAQAVQACRPPPGGQH